MNVHKSWKTGLIIASLALAAAGTALAEDKLLPVPEEIRVEATRQNNDPVGRPLPLVGHWDAGNWPNPQGGIHPLYQLDLIARGHYLLPWFDMPPNTSDLKNNGTNWYTKWMSATNEFEAPLRKAAELKLPISFLATQWEQLLSLDKKFFDLPPDQNPNLLTTNGTFRREVDLLGPIGPWKEVGKIWTASPGMKQVQSWYPNPPLVMFISNNEMGKGTEQRFIDQYGKDKWNDADFRRQVTGEGYVAHYRAMIQAMKDGLDNPNWKKNSIYMGYEAIGGPSFLGRDFSDEGSNITWKTYSDFRGGKFTGASAVWDAGSPSYYLHNWCPITDFKVWSPQIESMNWVFLIKKEMAVKPNYWFEMSTWDGNVDSPTDKRLTYLAMGQTLSPERYGGMIQFGMWLLRPRSVREFRGSNEPRKLTEPYFTPILEAVDRVHTNPTLRKFWRKGELVANHAHQHPYNLDIPEEYKNTDRWFLLDTDLDNPWPWNKFTEVPVFSLALVMGKAPEREWLVYTHAPKGARIGVKITVPDYGPITVDSPVSGSFYVVSEKDKNVKPLVIGGPASVGFDLKSHFVKPAEKIALQAADPYGTRGKLTRLEWDFGDGAKGDGARVEHAYKKAGQYIVSLKAANSKGETATKESTVFVGIGAEEGLALHYLMTKSPGEVMPDASGRDHVGFPSNTQWAEDPNQGTSLEFNGTNSCVSLLNTPDINVTNVTRRTIAFWFKPSALKKRQMLYKEGGPGGGLNLFLENGKLNGGAWAATTWKGTWLTADGIEAGKWYHVALVLNDATSSVASDKLALYLNGTKVATGSAAQIPPHTADISIGRAGTTMYPTGSVGDANGFFAGQMRQFLIYNRVLSETEIRKEAK